MNAPLRPESIFAPSWVRMPESALRFVTDREWIDAGYDAAYRPFIVERWTSAFGTSCVMTDANGTWALDIDAIGNDEPMRVATWIEPEPPRDEARLFDIVSGILARGDREADRREYRECVG